MAIFKRTLLPLLALFLLLFPVSWSLAQSPAPAFDQRGFTAFVNWFSSLDRNEQFARIKFPLKVRNNMSECGSDPVWEEKYYQAGEVGDWYKLLLSEEELAEEKLIRRIEDLSPTKKLVVEILDGAGYMQEFEFTWDGGSWNLTEIRYPSGGC